MKKVSALGKIALKIKYPKLILFALSIVLGVLIYTDENNFNFHLLIQKFGYFATFLAGGLFSNGLTLSPAIAILFLIGKTQPILIAGIVAIIGSIIGNFFIFQYLKISYAEEVDDASQTKIFRWLIRQLDRFTPIFIRKYILPIFAGIVSALPFPDEFATALVHASKDFSFITFSIFSFIFNAFGIFIILWIGKIL